MAPVNVFLAKKEYQSRQFLTQNQVVENSSRTTKFRPECRALKSDGATKEPSVRIRRGATPKSAM